MGHPKLEWIAVGNTIAKKSRGNAVLATSSLVWQAANKNCQDISQGNLLTD